MSIPPSFMMKSMARQLPQSPQYENQPNNLIQNSAAATGGAHGYSNRTRRQDSNNRDYENGREDGEYYDTVGETAVKRTLSEEMPYTALIKEPKAADSQKRDICLCVLLFSLAVGIILTCSLVPTLLLSRRIEMKLAALQDLNCTTEVVHEKQSQHLEPGLRIVHDSTCYCLYNRFLNWYQAKAFCLSKPGQVHLAELRSNETRDHVEPIIMAFIPDGTALWIGGTDLEFEGIMKWNFSDSLVDTFETSQWGPGEPNGKDGHCIEVAKNYGWNDANCVTGDKVFVCQSPLNADNRCAC